MSKLQPGRDMDKKVHTEVMGKQVTMGMAERTIWNPEIEQFEPHFIDIPHYSTNITAAWTVVEKFAAIGHSPLIEFYDGQWCADLTGYGNVTGACTKTIAHAICQAALKAAGGNANG